MAVLRRLLERCGFVKLGRYGLALTADDRIVSMRPAVPGHDGGRIVGWRDDDLAMTAAGPESTRATPVRPEPVIPRSSRPAQAAAPATSAAAMPVAVAPEAALDEDDWEWTIALARARVAAEEAQVPARGESAASDRKTWQMPTVAPTTVIPVPPLPSIRDVAITGRLEPVVRTPASRFAKGTASIGPDTEQTEAAVPDDTQQSLAIGDQTVPGIGMPLAARAVALPSTKRRPVRDR